MEAAKRGKRDSEAQKEYLITYMEQNLDFANDKWSLAQGEDVGRFSCFTKCSGRQLQRWRKYWADLKLGIKAKITKQREELGRSGINGPPIKELGAVEERVAHLMTKEAIEGDIGINLGFAHEIPDEKLEDIVEFAPESPTPHSEPRANKRKRQRLLSKDALDTFTEIENKKVELMKEANAIELKKVVVLSEISSSLKKFLEKI